MPTAVALLSGGLDSGVALASWLATPAHTITRCVTFDYGQRSAVAEARAARRLTDRFGLSLEEIALPFLADAARRTGSALVATGQDLPRGSVDTPGDAASAAAVWVPARNVVFLAVAASLAEADGAAFVLAGFNREEAETFPDNSEAFVTACDEVLRLGTQNGVCVASPTLAMDKVEIVAVARAHGMAAQDFFSCYETGPEPCGTCESCLRSARAWAAGAPNDH